MVHIWDTRGDSLVERSWRAHETAAKRAAWHPNGHHLVTEGIDEEVILWEARLGEKLVGYTAQSVGQLSFSPDGRRLGLFRRGDQVSLLEVEDGDGIMRQTVGHERHQVHGAAWHPSGLVMATSAEDMVKFWSRDGEFVGSLPVSSSRSVIWTSNALMVTGLHGIMKWPILQAPNGKDVKKLVFGKPLTMDAREGWQRAAMRVEGDTSHKKYQDGRWLVVTHPERILVLDLESKQPPLEIHGQPNAAFATVSPDETWVATGALNGPDVQIWSLPEGHPVHALRGTGGANVLFSPNGSMLVTANSVEYKIWETRNWSLIKSLRTHTGNYFGAMAFSPRLTALTLESERNKLRIIRPGNLEDLAAPDFDDQAPLTFSPDGVIMVNLDKKSHLIFWNLPKLRAGMSALGLDWLDIPPYPPIPAFSPVESVEFTSGGK
jgi:WD40 repeat protein